MKTKPILGKKNPRDSEATRLALMEAAIETFAQRGYHGATTERIARRAGVNKAMINYHFRSKKRLHDAVLLTPMAELLASARELLTRDLPPERLLRDFVGLFSSFAARRPSFPAMLLREVICGGELLGKEVVAHMAGMFGVAREIVSRGVRQGVFREVEPLLVHITAVGTINFFYATEPFRRRAKGSLAASAHFPSAEEYTRWIQDLLVRGLAQPPGPGARRPSPAAAPRRGRNRS